MSASLEASLKLDIAQYQAALAKARGEAKKFRDQLQSGGGFGKAFAGSGSMIAGLAGTAGLGLLVRRGLEFNQTIGDSEIAIGNVLRQFKGLDAQAARQEAAAAMQAMVDLEPQTAASLTGLVDGFLATLGASQAAGISVEQNIDLVGKFANVLANSNIPAEQLAQEMRSILSGNIGADSTLAKVLNITNADISKVQQTGKLYDFLNQKIGILGQAGDTAAVAMSTLQSAMDKAAGALTAGIFDQGVAGAKDLASALEENRDLFIDMGQGIALAGKELLKFLSFMNESRKIIMEISGINELKGALNARDAAAEATAMSLPGVSAANKAATAALAPRPSAAGGSSSSSSSPEDLLKAQRELNKLTALQASLDQKRFEDYLSILAPNVKLIELRREMMRLDQESAALAGPGLEDERIARESKVLDLRQQTRKVLSEIADQQKADAEKAGQQSDAIAAFQAEMDLINAKIAGNKELVAELEKQAQIQQIQRDLMDQAGLNEQDALTRAKQMVEAKKALEDQASKPDKDGTIKGYSRERQGGADEARQRAADRVDASRNERDAAVKDAFGTLGPRDPAANPLAAQAQKNTQKEAAQPAANPQQQLGQQVLALITQIFEAVK